jgi:FemAB-related protein (PEP-CTERM system-associated)
MTTITNAPAQTEILVHDARGIAGRSRKLEDYYFQDAVGRPLSLHPGWLTILAKGLKHTPYCLEAVDGDTTRGFLGLAYVSSFLFGKFLVSLPYLNYGGAIADDCAMAGRLVDRAVTLADELNVGYLELRLEHPLTHQALNQVRTDKVHMRLELPHEASKLWESLPAKVRNQVRKAQKHGLTIAWGGGELLADFYAVFSRNMRDLGTPVYPKRLFAQILGQFQNRAELCVVRAHNRPVAAALLLQGDGICEVPSASSLRDFNHTCANMLLYWQLLERAIQRRQRIFDFGRSTQESSTFRFKKQWGAVPTEAPWQYYVRSGNPERARRENPRFQRLIRIWQRMPVWLTRLMGPAIVRRIP